MTKWGKFERLMKTLTSILCGFVIFFCQGKGFSVSSAKEAGDVTIMVEAENVTQEPALKKVKYYLPSEILPQHIVDYAGLELGKDEGRLYLGVETEFDAHELKRFQVKVKDVWNFSSAMLDEYEDEAKRRRDSLEKTAYGEISRLLCAQIIKEVEEIRGSQGQAGSIQEHIEIFRKNEEKMTIVWQAIDRLRELNDTSEKQSSAKLAKERIETILFIVTSFLFVITGVFFMIWVMNPKARNSLRDSIK